MAFGPLRRARPTTTRTFTSVDAPPPTWTAAVEGLRRRRRGPVTPPAFDIAPGATQAVTLALTLAGAPPDAYTFGALVLTDAADGRTVRLPVSVRPVQIAARRPASVTPPGRPAAAPVAVRAGYAGTSSGARAGAWRRPGGRPGETVATDAGAATA